MSKTPSKLAGEIFDQVHKARQILDYFNEQALDGRGELADGALVRSRLNAAKAHLMRALEKAQTLR
ncbi:MAG: hypothetical protein HQM04_10125 [Magnetococcales bacterium]|nr:hypothetical protein [Magnetococcales bacterium]MBF0115387.1 hypothetical protein [Magnetococcales bacterium]